jgi:ABC-type phosphonate transport system ATPase subunit
LSNLIIESFFLLFFFETRRLDEHAVTLVRVASRLLRQTGSSDEEKRFGVRTSRQLVSASPSTHIRFRFRKRSRIDRKQLDDSSRFYGELAAAAASPAPF